MDASTHRTDSVLQNGGGVRAGGQAARFPNRMTINIDDELLGAIQMAARLDLEAENVIVRRWLRTMARAQQLLPTGGSNGG